MRVEGLAPAGLLLATLIGLFLRRHAGGVVRTRSAFARQLGRLWFAIALLLGAFTIVEVAVLFEFLLVLGLVFRRFVLLDFGG